MKKILLLGTLCICGLITTKQVDASTSKLYSENKKITVTTDKARLFNNSQLKAHITLKKGNVYKVNGYRNIDGKHYYRLYQTNRYNESSYCGYLYKGYAKDLTMTKASGNYKIKPSMNIWKNFYFNQKQTPINKEQVVYIKGYYVLGDNKKYYSLYQKDANHKEQWLGYTYSSNITPFNSIDNKQKLTLKQDATTKDNIFMNHTKHAFQFDHDVVFYSPRYYTLNQHKIYSLYRPNAKGKQEWVGYLPEQDIQILQPTVYQGDDVYRVKAQQATYYTNLYLTEHHTATHTQNFSRYFDVKYLYHIGNKTYASIYWQKKYVDTSQNSDSGKWLGYIDFSALESDMQLANEQDYQYLKEQMDKVKQVEAIKTQIDATSYQTLKGYYACAEEAYNHKPNSIRGITSVATTLDTQLHQLKFNKNPLIKAIRDAKYDLKDNCYTNESKRPLQKVVDEAQSFLDHATDEDLLYKNKGVADRYITQIEEARKQLVLQSVK